MMLYSSVGAEATGDALVAVNVVNIVVERVAEPSSGLMVASSTAIRDISAPWPSRLISREKPFQN